MWGFSMGSLLDPSQFYRFLPDTNNSSLQDLRHSIIKGLFDKNIIPRYILIVDSNPVMPSTIENNFKKPKRNSRNKKLKRLYGFLKGCIALSDTAYDERLFYNFIC
jgi:hypothetical protein